jgi:hypothetical protein
MTGFGAAGLCQAWVLSAHPMRDVEAMRTPQPTGHAHPAPEWDRRCRPRSVPAPMALLTALLAGMLFALPAAVAQAAGAGAGAGAGARVGTGAGTGAAGRGAGPARGHQHRTSAVDQLAVPASRGLRPAAPDLVRPRDAGPDPRAAGDAGGHAQAVPADPSCCPPPRALSTGPAVVADLPPDEAAEGGHDARAPPAAPRDPSA